MTDPIVDIRGLRKSYGSVVALDGLDARIPEGAVGLLGPNGAGKSTLLKLCLGLLVPDQGSARVAGRDPRQRGDRLALRQLVGYMPESDCLLPGMNALELVATLGRVVGMRRRDAITRAHEMLDYVGIEESRYRVVDDYSTGMKQRVKLAQALVHDPPLLLLDEPTNGLDPKGRREMLELVHDLGHAQGKNLLFCSHLLPDVERTCDSVVVLHRGRGAGSGVIAEMTAGDARWVRVDADGRSEVLGAALAEAGWDWEPDARDRLRVALPEGDDDADALFALAGRAGIALAGVEPVRSSLGDVFLQVLREAEQEA